jgi:hypothetical protein
MIISPEVNFVSYFRYSYAYIHESFVYILRPFLLKKHSLLLTVRKKLPSLPLLYSSNYKT